MFQEIVLPNKKYKGESKLSPVSSPLSTGFPEFDSPKVSTPNLTKSHTAVFLKKALSKSATPKKKKRLGEELSKNASSEPRRKRVNFALTRNMSQVTFLPGVTFFIIFNLTTEGRVLGSFGITFTVVLH